MEDTRANENTRVNYVFIIFAIALFSLSLAYLGKGFFWMLFVEHGAKDLYLRWVSQNYILVGLNPYDFHSNELLNQALDNAEHFSNQQLYVMKTYGPAEGAGYPPWTYFFNIFLVPPFAWNIVVWYFAALNLLSLTVVSFWSYRLGSKFGRSAGCLLAAMTLAIGANSTCLSNGQYGIVLNALLILAFWGSEWLGIRSLNGLCLAISLLKPNYTLLFGWSMIVHRKWGSFLLVMLLIISCSLAIGVLTATSPVSMLLQTQDLALKLIERREGDVNGIFLLMTVGMDPGRASSLMFLFSLLASGGLTFVFRKHSTLVLTAIAAVIGKTTTYHGYYDNTILVFLLVALGVTFLSRRLPAMAAVFATVGLTLWAPAKLFDPMPAQIAQLLIWISALAFLLWSERREAKRTL